MILEFRYTRGRSEDLEELALKAIGQVWYVGFAHTEKEAAVKWENQIDFPDEGRI